MILSLLVATFVHAAPHATPFPQTVRVEMVKDLLLAGDNADKIKRLGPEAYKHLREIMFSGKESVENRWAATMTVAKIGGAESRPDINTALQNQVWFMRSAGLLANSLISKDKGAAKAKEFMHKDPALLVRATALQVLAQNENFDRDFVWKEVYNPINFNNGQSLSIRLSMVQLLAKRVKKTETNKFIALMREDAPEIRDYAKQTLETIYRKKAPAGLSNDKQIAYWQDVN